MLSCSFSFYLPFTAAAKTGVNTYHTVKTLAVKSLVKRLLQRIGKKTLANDMLTCIANHQSSINSKMRQFQTSTNIIKRTLYFPGFVSCHMLVACCLMMARCTIESMICDYYKYVNKLSAN